MDELQTSTAEAFSRKAAVYDAFGENHPNLARMRARVQDEIRARVPPGSRLLELNAGTGADAAALARAGYDVLATDISPGMLAKAEARRSDPAVGGRLRVQALSFTELDELKGQQFDLVYSNMGGLNCTADLRPVTRGLKALLAVGGYAVFVIMPRICPWEWAALLRGDVRTAVRRLRAGGVIANVEGLDVPTFYFRAGEVLRAFGSSFERVGLESLALASPPTDYKGFAEKYPRLNAFLAHLDSRIAGLPPFRGWGDFFMLTMRRTA